MKNVIKQRACPIRKVDMIRYGRGINIFQILWDIVDHSSELASVIGTHDLFKNKDIERLWVCTALTPSKFTLISDRQVSPTSII